MSIQVEGACPRCSTPITATARDGERIVLTPQLDLKHSSERKLMRRCGKCGLEVVVIVTVSARLEVADAKRPD